MNMGLKIILLYWIMIGCASTPKPVVKKKVGTAAPAAKTVKGPAATKPAATKPAATKPAATKPATPPPAEEEEVHEEEDDQFSRIKKYYKK
jgi:hypothetical protein